MPLNAAIYRALILLACFALLAPLIANERPLAIWYLPSASYLQEYAEFQSAIIPDVLQVVKEAEGLSGQGGSAAEARMAQAFTNLRLKMTTIKCLLEGNSSTQSWNSVDNLIRAQPNVNSAGSLRASLEAMFKQLMEELDPERVRLRAMWGFPVWNSVGWAEVTLLLMIAAVCIWRGWAGGLPKQRKTRSWMWTVLLVAASMACIFFKVNAGPDSHDFSSIRGSDSTLLYLASPVSSSSETIDLYARFSPPSQKHWLGTDSLGRDLLSRLIWGARISLAVALLALAFQLAIGVVLGGLAVMPPRWVCSIFSRCIDGLVSVPPLFLALAVGALLGANLVGLVTAIALAGSLPVAQLFRAELRRVNGADYVLAARNLGLHRFRVFRYHLLPNALAPVFGHIGYGVAASILMESSLSFLGLGIQAPAASWGGILSEARGQLELWWIMFFPGICILATVTLIQKMAGHTQTALAIKPRQA